MTNRLRKRALDGINLDEWRSYNPLFLSAVSNFDEAFDRGVQLDLAYYVPRVPIKSRSFEHDLLELLFSVHNASKTKIYTLVGSVGTGKTSTCRYIQEKIQNETDDLLVIRVDVWPLEEYDFETHTKLNQLLLESVYNSLKKKGIVDSRVSLYKLLLISMGFKEHQLTVENILSYESQFQPKHIIDLLEIVNVRKILFIFDNIDESSLEMIAACQQFAMDLSLMARSRGKTESSVSMLFPVREYTAHRHFFNQERYAHIDITIVDEAEILSKKVEQVRDSIEKSAASYSQRIDYGKFSRKARRHIIHGKKITIAQESMTGFLKKLGEIILSHKEREFYQLVSNLSNGNLKILVGNTYNFLHSCKLPLTNLFMKIFIPNKFHYSANIPHIPFNMALECLMTIHYPFYDVANSHIINLFNVLNSNVPNDYQNTLVSIRILSYLRNCGDSCLENLTAELNNVGYSDRYITFSINKLFEFGLINSDHGCCIEYLNDMSHIGISKSGIFYLDIIIQTPNYLQLACEDTPMCPEYIVNIVSKYPIHGDVDCNDHLPNRLRSVSLFLDFINEEEKIEQEIIQNELHKDWNTYLFNFSFRNNDSGSTISDVLRESWNNQQKKIQNVLN